MQEPTMTNLSTFLLSFRILSFVLELESEPSTALNHLRRRDGFFDHGGSPTSCLDRTMGLFFLSSCGNKGMPSDEDVPSYSISLERIITLKKRCRIH